MYVCKQTYCKIKLRETIQKAYQLYLTMFLWFWPTINNLCLMYDNVFYLIISVCNMFTYIIGCQKKSFLVRNKG